jgi:hypothetical protein
MAVHSFKHTTELYGRAAVRENRNAWEDSIRKSPEMQHEPHDDISVTSE